MTLEQNEFTTNSLVSYLNNEFGGKLSNKNFNHSDIAQYCIRGYLPYRYGGNKLLIKYEEGIKIIVLGEISSKRKDLKKVPIVKVKKVKRKLKQAYKR